MSRLTYKKPDGTWGMTNGFNMSEVPGKIYGALWKLKEYEDSELSPEQLKHIDALYLKKCQEVNELKLQIIKLERARAEEIKTNVDKYSNNGWILCSERLPEKMEDVLISVKSISGSKVALGYYGNIGLWCFTDGFGSSKLVEPEGQAIAWQQLPETYRGVRHE